MDREEIKTYTAQDVVGILAQFGIFELSILTLASAVLNHQLDRPVSGEMQPLAKVALDIGLPVSCYWRDLDYSRLDPRLGMGTIR